MGAPRDVAWPLKLIMPLNGGSTLAGINLSTMDNNCPNCLDGREQIDGMLLSVYSSNTSDTVGLTGQICGVLFCCGTQILIKKMGVKMFFCLTCHHSIKNIPIKQPDCCLKSISA